MSAEKLRNARVRSKGFWYEDLVPGNVFEHHWGKTVTQAENALFTTLTLHFNPQYTNVEFARAMGHADTPINPLLVFTTVFGLSVQDLSENGIALLGVEDLRYLEPVYPGDTLFARSRVLARRPSSTISAAGIATWRTQGMNQHHRVVCEFTRTNLLRLHAGVALQSDHGDP